MNMRNLYSLTAALLAASALTFATVPSALAATPPRVDSSQPTPVIYPMGAQSNGEEGTVDIALFIDSSGHPTGRYKMLVSSGHSDLDQAALQSALNWHYVAARDGNGETYADWVRIHIDYKLPPEERRGAHR